MDEDGRSERLLYLLGRDISHSLSPPTWNGVFQEIDVPWRYGLLDVSAEGLNDAFERLRDGRAWAFNVTAPHKAWAFEVATRPDERTARARAANWLRADGDDVVAANTDAEGASALLGLVGPVRHALVLGAGGAAAAILVALEGRASSVTMANRTRERADELASRARSWLPELTVVAWEERHDAAAEAELIANATSFGTGALPSCPLEALPARDDLRVYDLVYREGVTPLVRLAGDAGAVVADGLAHLEAQAVAMLSHMGLSPDLGPRVRAHMTSAAGREALRWSVPDPGPG